jgi:hypothetical protein
MPVLAVALRYGRVDAVVRKQKPLMHAAAWREQNAYMRVVAKGKLTNDVRPTLRFERGGVDLKN